MTIVTTLAIIGGIALLLLIAWPIVGADWTPKKVYPRLYTNDDGFNLCPRCNVFHGDRCPSKTTYQYHKDN